MPDLRGVSVDSGPAQRTEWRLLMATRNVTKRDHHQLAAITV